MTKPIEVQLTRVVIQEKDHQQYIHLTERGGARSFPIVIGFNEAMEINRKLHREESQRPLTHDLITRILGSLGFRIARVVINDLRDATFYATLVLDNGAEEKLLDCRPSDAIALAVQTRARIFVAPKVLDAVAS
ncbi:MAG: bifunctional nuclease family protein [Planctomycetes bacterium]|nr:bifunctional nuclease family protein [Planctomycetota bacterium]